VVLITLLMGSPSAADSPEASDIYRIGQNDIIRIQVFGEEDLTIETKVAGDGSINYPLLGSVLVGGKTVKELQDYLAKRLAEGYVRSPRVTVLMVRYRNFYLSGEVRTPGAYPFEAGLTVRKAISMGGGFTDKAEMRHVMVTRRVDDRTDTMSLALEAPVSPDDIIVAGQMQKFYVTGEVKTPGRYLFEPGLTVQKALSMAGGMTEKGDPSSIRMTRLDDVAVKTLSVGADTAIEPDDIIVVDAQNKKFYVSGEVKLPGGYVYKDGLTVQKALVMAGGPSEKAEKSALKIVRQTEGREETVPATLATVVQAEDTIVVPEGQKFYVTGEVKTPGRYLFEPGLTVQKALSMAGGMTEKADPAGVKLTRPKATGVELATVLPDALVFPDDILVVEGQIHKFYVSGEVRVPGSYSYKEGLTVQKALAMAGGQSDKAEKGALKIVRKADGQEETLAATLATTVLPEDTIVVPEGQKFYVSGEVKTPGRYLFEPGLTVQKALSMAGGLTEKADKGEIKINRLEAGIVQTMALNVHDLIQPNDVVVVAQAQKIFVEGEVKHPGHFTFEKGMTVHMAIAMAGGFTDKASQNGTKILRNLNGQEQSERAKLDGPVQPNDIIVVPQRFF
jgi:protein involved in polysaccharide export with SLBB domain